MDSKSLARDALLRISPDVCIQTLASGDLKERIVAAIAREDTRRRRASPLSPCAVVWLTLAMGLYRTRSIPDAFAQVLSQARGRLALPLEPVSDGALAHARERLGPKVTRALFEDLARESAPAPCFHGLRVHALDAVVLSCADTPANEKAFGRPKASRGRSAFPQLRLATISAVRTRELRAASFGAYEVPERTLGEQMALKTLSKGDLLLMDRGFTGVGFCGRLWLNGVDFVARMRRHLKAKVTCTRRGGDFDVELKSRRRAYADRLDVTLKVRLIEYTLDGEGTVRLLTSLTDPAITAREIVDLYHERWEAETSYDEIKTHLASVRCGGLHLPLRGKSPRMVEQELWALLSTYTLVRRLIAAAARRRGIDPRRISFTSALTRIQDRPPAAGDPSAPSASPSRCSRQPC